MTNKTLILIVPLLIIILVILIFNKSFSIRKLSEEDHPKTPINHIPTSKAAPTENEKAEPRESLSKYTSDYFQAGMNLLVYGDPNISEAKRVFEQLRLLGINSVSINFSFLPSRVASK